MTSDLDRQPPTLDRRTLLHGSALLVPMALARKRRPRQSGRSAIVVGAGVAGLRAAADLVAGGYTVTVLEGRSRIGGRTWTIPADDPANTLGRRVDLGAGWIHGLQDANPIAKLARQQGWALLPTDYDDETTYAGNGARVADATVDQMYTLFENVLQAARNWADTQNNDRSLQAAIDREIGRRNLSATQARWVNHFVNTEIEHDYAGAADDLSVWWWDNDQWLGGRQDAMVRDGYRQLVSLLAAGLDIRTGQVVKRIDHGTSGVTVTVQSGQTFQANACVVTVPLGVLRAATTATAGITFSPALPSAHRTAIAGLRTGVLNRLYLTYPTRFWADTALLGYVDDVTKGRWAEWYDVSAITGAPTLLGFNAAAYGAAIEAKSATAIRDEAQAVLRTIYGNGIPNPTGHLATKWLADPFALGSYAHVPPGMNTTAYGTLGKSAGPRLFLAGEHTTKDYPNTVHGAWLTGQRAAQQVRQVLG